MALKFRRGTTAQQSGSLAFGEPYVNTTLGTLVVGGVTGDIILSSTGTGSTGNFGAISGSGLDITGNANIAGNLTLGGAITIGDASADTVNVIASLSSSLIPSTTNAFDLGSASKIWRDLYISTGSIKFVAGTTVVKEFSLATLTNLEVATGSSNISLTNLNTTTASLIIETTNLETFSSSALTRLTNLEVETANLETFSGSVNTRLTEIGVVSGSLITSASVASVSITNLNSTTASLNTSVTNINSTTASLNTSVTNINLTTASLNTSVTNLNSFSSSQLTQNSTLATYTGSVNTRLTEIGVVSGSLITSASTAKTTNDSQGVSITNLNTFSGSTLTRLSALEVETTNLESFTSSINTTIKTRLNAETVVSGSSQITYASISSIPAGIVSGSSQVTPLLPNGVVSGSSQVNADTITNFDTNVKDKLNTDLVVSGSASDVKTFLSLGNVTNESKATMFTSAALTGTPTAPTAVANTNSTQIATTAYVQQELTDLIGGASAAFDTLIEISASLASGDSTLNTLVDGKLSKASNLSDLTDTSAARTNLGVAIGTNVQAYNATLAAVAGGTYSGDDSITTIGTVSAGSVTAILPNGTVSGSSQVIGILSSLNTYTGSNDTTNTTQNTRLTALEASASTALSTNNTQATSITNLNSATASLLIETANLESFSSSALTRLSALEVETANLESFSSSALTRLSNLEGTDFTITLTGDVTGVGTVTNLGNVSFATTVAANSVELGTDTTGNYMSNISAGNAGIVISHTQGEGSTATISLVSGAVSGSSQITAGSTTNFATDVKTQLNSNTVVSGSSQINVASTTGDIALGTRTSGNYVATMTAGTGITVGTATGEGSTPVITNTGVTSNVAGTGVSVSGATGAVTISIGQAVATSSSPTFAGLTINGAITATGDITAFFSSDRRFKSNIQLIPNALDKVSKLNGVTWTWNEDVNEVTKTTPNTGLIAQEVQEVLPEVVKEREDGHLGLDYSKMVGLLVEAIKEQQLQIEQLRIDLDNYECKCDNCKSK